MNYIALRGTRRMDAIIFSIILYFLRPFCGECLAGSTNAIKNIQYHFKKRKVTLIPKKI